MRQWQGPYLSGTYTMATIAKHFDVHDMTASRSVRKIEGEQRATLGP